MMRLRHGWLALGIATFGVVAAGPSAARATFLTGAIVYSTDTTGAPSSGEFWNTVGGDNRFNLYLSAPGDPMTVGLLNTGNGASTGINFDLGPGTYSYQLYGENTQGTAAYGIGLFLNSDNANPAVAAFASPGLGVVPAAAGSVDIEGVTTTSPGSLSFNDGTNLVTLTGFQWAAPSPAGGGPDRVSAQDSVSSGQPNFLGTLSLTVTAVPEPGSMALLGLGIAGAGAMAQRRKGRASTK